MKGKIFLFLIAILFAAAATGQNVTSFVNTVDEDLLIPCTGEVVHFEGETLTKIQDWWNPNNPVIKYRIITNHHATGICEATGNHYIWHSLEINNWVTAGGQINIHVGTAKVKCLETGDEWIGKITDQIVINPAGTTVNYQVDSYQIECN